MMKVKELDNVLNEILVSEAKKVIMEQITDTDHLIDSIKGFQTLSGFLDKITDISQCGGNGFCVTIQISKVKPEDLVKCCGGRSFSEAQTKLMQGLHHDLEDGGLGDNFDIDINAEGDENELTLVIKIVAGNDMSSENDMEEQKMDEKKEILLGNKKSCTECGKSLKEDNATGKCEECSNEMLEMGEEKDEKWIQKAVDPKHKGYCTPMTKPTCTPRRKALAKRFKKGIEKESIEKKIITLNETEMAELIKKVITEGVPGIDTTKRVTKVAKEQNDEALKAVEKKIKEYLTFKGNDNPKFPNQIGQGEDKAARQNTTEEDEIVAINRGQGVGDPEFDHEPSKEYRKRQKEALTGSSRMGNPTEAGNAIKTDVGEKIADDIEKRKDAKKQEPLYQKETVPVETEKKDVQKREVNESVIKDISKMMHLTSYNEKTQ